MFAAALGAFLAAIEDGCQHFLKPLRLKQSALDMAATRSSSFSMGIERPLQPVSPCRALIEQV